jgi:Tol biopolymer transport system component
MRFAICLFVLMFLMTACGGSASVSPTPQSEVVVVEITATALPATATVPPTATVLPTATLLPATPEPLRSNTANGGSTNPVISGDGRYIVFESLSNDVSPDARQTPCDIDFDGYLDNKCRNIYLYDRELNQAELVTVGRNNFPAEGSSFYPSINDNGDYIAFMSFAGNLDEDDESWCIKDEIRTSCQQIFLNDRTTDQIHWISRAFNGGSPDGNSYLATASALSSDGRFLVYMSYATNLVEEDSNESPDVFLYDRTTEKTSRLSLSSEGEQGNGPSYFPFISGNGEYVAFVSMATNLVPDDTNGEPDIFVYSLATREISRVSIASDGREANSFSDYPALSDDGRYILFESPASNLVPEDNNTYCEIDGDRNTRDNCRDIFMHDRQTGETSRVSVGTEGDESNNLSMGNYLAGNSQILVFASLASNLVSEDNNGTFDVFVRDTENQETIRISLSSDGEEGNHHSGIAVDPVQWRPSFGISNNGRYIVFSSSSDTWIERDWNDEDECNLRRNGLVFAPDCNDIFLHDRETGETLLISSPRKTRN